MALIILSHWNNFFVQYYSDIFNCSYIKLTLFLGENGFLIKQIKIRAPRMRIEMRRWDGDVFWSLSKIIAEMLIFVASRYQYTFPLCNWQWVTITTNYQLNVAWIFNMFYTRLKHLFKITHIWLGLEQTASFGQKIEDYFMTDLLFPQNQV